MAAPSRLGETLLKFEGQASPAGCPASSELSGAKPLCWPKGFNSALVCWSLSATSILAGPCNIDFMASATLNVYSIDEVCILVGIIRKASGKISDESNGREFAAQLAGC